VTAGPSQGEAVVTWALWGLMTAAVVSTYSWVAPEETYHVSREGIAGGLSRALTLVNFPIALAAIALALEAMAVLPRRGWLLAGPAIGLCATIPWLVDQDDLDARWVNAIPALGVAVALGLTVAATRRAGAAFAPAQPLDRWRVGAAIVVALVSLPWLTAELGFHFPGDVFMGEEVGLEADGTPIAAVHLGHHHGTDGSLLVLTALLLSRMPIAAGRLRLAFVGYVALMLSYGAVNMVQDAWNEQVVKRGWTDELIPSALLPGIEPIWGVVLAVAALGVLVLLRESGRTAYSAP
jgi:hypothetical protein